MKKRVLVVAPHPDDETLGAGGAIAKYVEAGNEVTVLVVSGHLPPLYGREDYEVTVREARKAFSVLGIAKSKFLEIPATMVGEASVGFLNGEIAGMVKEIEPNIVLCPFPDRHIDHRVVFESVMVSTRPVGAGRCIELIAAYETLSETHWNAPHMEPNFVPNWTVDITAQIDRKIEALACYESQIPPFPGSRSLDAVKALAMFRGTQAGFAFGESFQIVRMIG
jgi:LmbE family N-acetylglucosaminyl deacetylase